MRDMRRNNRLNNNNKDAMQNKIIMYSIIGIGILTIILVALLIYSKNLSEDMENNLVDFEEIANVQNENNNTNTESVSTEIGKSVNDALNETNTTSPSNVNNTINESTTTNTVKETTKSTSTETTTNTNKKEDVKESKEEKKELAFEKPVEGEIMKVYAKDNLVFSNTLQEWTTHLGIDIKADKTTVVKSAEAGTIKTIKNDPRYGLTITIEHDNGYQTVYANLLSSEFVVEGETVEKGQSIGTVGNTATFEISDEPHLHFEVLKDGVQIDPTTVIK